MPDSVPATFLDLEIFRAITIMSQKTQKGLHDPAYVASDTALYTTPFMYPLLCTVPMICIILSWLSLFPGTCCLFPEEAYNKDPPPLALHRKRNKK
jgi:hypothetical protein